MPVLPGYSYERFVLVKNHWNSNILTNYPVRVLLHQNWFDYSLVKPNGDDVRFVDDDGTTVLDYWIEKWNTTGYSYLWVEIPSIPAYSEKTIYMDYGNAGAPAYSNGANTFTFFDDFPGSSIDAGKWNVLNGAGFSVSGGNLLGTDTTGVIESVNTYSTGISLLAKLQIVTRPTSGFMASGWRATSSTTNGVGYAVQESGTNEYYFLDGAWTAMSGSLPLSIDVQIELLAKSNSVDLRSTRLDTNAVVNEVLGISKTLTSLPIRIGKVYDDSVSGESYDARWDAFAVRSLSIPDPEAALVFENSAVINPASSQNYKTTTAPFALDQGHKLFFQVPPLSFVVKDPSSLKVLKDAPPPVLDQSHKLFFQTLSIGTKVYTLQPSAECAALQAIVPQLTVICQTLDGLYPGTICPL